MSQDFLFLLAGLLLGLSLIVWRARPLNQVNRLFALQTTVLAMWVTSIAQIRGGGEVELAARLAFVSASFIPGTILFFGSSFPYSTDHPSQRLINLSFCSAAILSILALGSDLIIYDIRGVDTFRRSTGILYPLYAVHFIGFWVTAVVVFVRKWWRSRGVARVQLQYLSAAILVASVGGMTTNLLLPLITGRSTYFDVGPYFAFGYILLVCHAIIRHRLMDLRLMIHRGLTFAIATTLSLVPAAVLVALLGPRVSLHLTPGEIAVALFAILVVALLIPITRDVASRLLDRYVYRKQANYRRTVREASRELTRVLNLRKLVSFMQGTMVKAVECEGVALYLRRGDLLRRTADERCYPDVQFEAPDEMPNAVRRRLQDTKDLVVTEELLAEPASSPLHSELTQLNWALVLPAMSENVVIGAIVLGPKRSGDPYYPQDFDLLMTLANQAGIAIKNAQLYAEVVLANEYLENIVATITSGVVAVDADGTVTMFNPTAEQLTGLTRARMHGRPLTALPPSLGDALAATLRDGFARTQPEVDLSDGVTMRPVMCTTSPLRDPDGAPLGAVAVFSDLTPVRELEIERRRVERLAYLETFASGIAHEVKNPLVAIKTFVQLIPRRREDEHFVEEFTRVVTREIARMERLVGRLRTLSRPGERAPRVLDVRQPLVDALEFMQAAFEEREVSVEAALGEAEAPVMGDGAELEQLFLNLLMNANEATPSRGRISVAVLRSDGRVAVAVADSGPGIPEEALGRVFDPFFTTKERGSGLGLAISAGIADTHHARLRVENVMTGGARFTVEFPLASEVPAPVAS